MGDQAIHAEATQQEGVVSTYSVIVFPARDLPKEYLPLIFSKWLRSLRHGNDYFKLADSEAYYRTYHNYIEVILGRAGAVVRLAVLSDDKDVVLGFSVSRGNILEYVHVHKDHRNLGIGRNLVSPDIDTVTHLTRTALNIWAAKYKHWKFNPFA